MDITAALADIDGVLANPDPKKEGGYIGMTTQMVRYHACINRYAPPGSSFRKQADSYATHPMKGLGPSPPLLMRGILAALREDVAADRLGDFESIIRANVYGDLLEQAAGLHADTYDRAATVIVGAALEDHLKKLATKHGIALVTAKGGHKQASAINTELRAAGVYAEPQRSIIDGWQKVRNEAAHGNPGFEPPDTQYVASVGPMISGVRGFVAQYPA